MMASLWEPADITRSPSLACPLARVGFGVSGRRKIFTFI